MAEPVGHLGWRRASERARAGRHQAAVRFPRLAVDPALVSRLTYGIVAVYAITFAVLSILEHDSFNTHAFDLGNMDQAVWNTVHGRWFEFTNWEGGTTRLAAHFEPILPLIAPLYKLWSSPKALLVLQAVALALGALPAYWLARERLRNLFAAITFAAAYLLSPALEMANLADFHPVALASPLLLLAFYLLYRERYGLFLVAAILAMATKEHVALTVALFGVYLIWGKGERAWGLTTLGLSLAWLAVAFLVIIPVFNPTGASPYLSRYDYLGGAPKDILLAALANPARVGATLLQPERLAYARSLVEPTAYTGLLSPFVAFALPDLAINLLSNYPDMYAGKAHYGAVLAPLIVVSAIFGVGNIVSLSRRLSPLLGQLLLYLTCLVVLAFSLRSYYASVFLPLVEHPPQIDDHDRLAAEVTSLVPNDARLCTSSALNPHLSQRPQIYLFGVKDPARPAELYCVPRSDFILLDVTSNPYPVDAPEQRWRVGELLAGREWGVVAAKDGYLLLRRGAGGAELPDAFFSFVRARPQEVPARPRFSFGDSLDLVGYRFTPEGPLHGNDPYVSLSLFFEASRPLTADYSIVVSAVADGTVLESKAYHAATTWYPTSRWQIGEIVRVKVDRLSVKGATAASVLLAVVAGRDPGAVEARLRPAGDASAVVERNQVRLGELRVE